jgi:thiamine kinase-like enzyme
LEEQVEIFLKIVNNIKSIHEKKSIKTVRDDVYETYYNKTLSRLSKIIDLVPFAGDETININNKKYKNPLFYFKDIKTLVERFIPSDFRLIHGDITMSNMIFEKRTNKVYFIDPRGYFGNTLLYGDPYYDWAKLYYSVIGNYDQFNKKKFSLDISNNGVKLHIEPNNWSIDKKMFYDFTETNGKSN